jgi:hypothetical protein
LIAHKRTSHNMMPFPSLLFVDSSPPKQLTKHNGSICAIQVHPRRLPARPGRNHHHEKRPSLQLTLQHRRPFRIKQHRSRRLGYRRSEAAKEKDALEENKSMEMAPRDRPPPHHSWTPSRKTLSTTSKESQIRTRRRYHRFRAHIFSANYHLQARPHLRARKCLGILERRNPTRMVRHCTWYVRTSNSTTRSHLWRLHELTTQKQ